LLAMKAFVFDKEPNLAFQHVIDLLRFMLVGFGMITGRSGGDHEAALVTVTLSHNHGSGSRFPALDSFGFRYVRVLYMKWHR